MSSAFRKISRVGSLMGATRWYLSEDCLLASKGNYTVEYRRFYLRDLDSIVVWPDRFWPLRPIIPGVVLGALGALLGYTVDFTTGAIFGGIGLAWALLELALGPTAKTRIRTTGATFDLPLVKRARRAHRVLGRIDAAVRAARSAVIGQPTAPMAGLEPKEPSVKTSSEPASATVSIADATQTNGS